MAKLSNYDSMYQSLRETRSETLDVGQYERRLSDLEYLVHALWELCKAKGSTAEELEQAIDSVMELRKTPDYAMNYSVACTRCNRPLQRVNSFQMRCMYCNMQLTISPYDKYEKKDE